MRRRRLAGFVIAAVLAGAVAYGWSVVRRGFSARDEPSRLEAWLARGARSVAVPASARDLENPQPATAENLRDGMIHFADHCAVCHGNDGSGDTDFGRNMYPRPPDMRLLTQTLTDGQIYYTIQHGVRLTGMPAFGEPHRDDDPGTWNLVHFIRRLPHLSEEEEAEMRRHNPISRADLEQEMQIERFLAGEDVEPEPAHKHEH